MDCREKETIKENIMMSLASGGLGGGFIAGIISGVVEKVFDIPVSTGAYMGYGSILGIILSFSFLTYNSRSEKKDSETEDSSSYLRETTNYEIETSIDIGNAGESQLIKRLIILGNSGGDEAFHRSHKPETIQIGEKLNEINGIELMRKAHTMVHKKCGSMPARNLEVAWHKIGEWRG